MIERVAVLDIGKAEVVCRVRLPAPAAQSSSRHNHPTRSDERSRLDPDSALSGLLARIHEGLAMLIKASKMRDAFGSLANASIKLAADDVYGRSLERFCEFVQALVKHFSFGDSVNFALLIS